MINDIKNYNKFQITITLIILLSFCITGATYAYFAISATDSDTITGDAATVNLTLSVDKVFPLESSENTGVMVPQLSPNKISSVKVGNYRIMQQNPILINREGINSSMPSYEETNNRVR